MDRKKAYKLGLGNLIIGVLAVGFSLTQGGLNADATTVFDQGIVIVKLAFVIGTVLVAGGIACFAYAVMAQK